MCSGCIWTMCMRGNTRLTEPTRGPASPPPLGGLDLAWAGRLFFLVDLAAVLAATALLLHLFGLCWRGLAGAISIFGLGLAWPVIFTLDAGNVNGPVLLGLAAFLLAATRRR